MLAGFVTVSVPTHRANANLFPLPFRPRPVNMMRSPDRRPLPSPEHPMIRPLFLFAAAFFLITQSHSTAQEKNTEAERLLGSWVVQSAKEEGHDVPDLQKAHFTFDKDGRLTLELAGISEKVELRYNLETELSPRVIEITSAPLNTRVGTRKEHDKKRGIFKIDGDTLTLCIYDGPDPDQLPREFEAKVRYVTLVVLKRTTK
jgi:uncharacterized protein (TIGR03067 family)